MSKVSFKGVLVGGITDIIASTILALPIIVYVMLTKIDLGHLPSNQVGPAITAALHANGLLFASVTLIGMGCSILGGYVGARLAKHDELINGSLTSVLCLAFGIYSLGTGTGSTSTSLEFLMTVVASPVLGLMGGYLRARQKRDDGATLQPTTVVE
jgi:hypothetical protein